MSEFLPPVVARLVANIDGFRAGMLEARGEMAKVESSSVKMDAAISRAGKSSSLAVLGVAGYSVHLAASFEQATNVLKTAAGETDAGLKVVRDGIKQVAMQTGVSFSQLESGAYVLEKAGYRGANAVQMLRVASQGAREENADLGTVLNAMTSVMASYHLKTSDSVRVMNALKTGAGEAKTSMEDYAGALSTVLPIASAAHISFADVAGAFATLTQPGTSAAESTQELAATIRALQAPNSHAVKMMQQLGLNVVDVTSHLGSRGLTGTLDLLSTTIMQHMGPSGLVLLNAFNQSKTAAQDADIMIGNMPKSIQKLAAAFRDGQLSTSDWRSALKGLPVDQANLLRQFASLENRARGFSDQIRSGGPAAQTYTAVLKTVTGGAIGLNTALQLTGENMAGTKTRVEAVSRSFSDSSRDVEGWSTTANNATTAMSGAENALKVVAMGFGDTLLPAVKAASQEIERHRGFVEAVAGAIGVGLVGAMGLWIGKLAWGTVQTDLKIAKWILRWDAFGGAVKRNEGDAAMSVETAQTAENRAIDTTLAKLLELQTAFQRTAKVEGEASAAGAAAVSRNAAAADAAMTTEAATAVASAGRISAALAGLRGLAAGPFGGVFSVLATSGDSPGTFAGDYSGLSDGKIKKQLFDMFNKQGFAGTVTGDESKAFWAAMGIKDPTKLTPQQRVSGTLNRSAALAFLERYGNVADPQFEKLRSALGFQGSTGGGLDDYLAMKSGGLRIVHPAKAGDVLGPDIAALMKMLDASIGAGIGGGGFSGGGAAGGSGNHRHHHGRSHAQVLADRAAAHARRVANHQRVLEMAGLRSAESDFGHLLSEGKATERSTHQLLPPKELAALEKTAQTLLARARRDEKHLRGTRQHAEALNLLHRAEHQEKMVKELEKLSEHAKKVVDNTRGILLKDCSGLDRPLTFLEASHGLNYSTTPMTAEIHLHIDGHEMYRSVQRTALRKAGRNVNNGFSR